MTLKTTCSFHANTKDFDSVTKMLRYDTFTCHQVRALFHGTVASYLEIWSRMSPDASTIMHPTFESEIIKIQSGKATDMSQEEKLIVQDLKAEGNT